MKIASWNVNSVRSRLARLLDYLKLAQPDVLCLQELKCEDAQFPREPIEAAGYRAVCHGQRAYNGVAILAREEPTEVSRGLGDGVEDPQSRLIAATVGGVRIACVYAPNGQAVGTPAYAHKLEWFARLRGWLERDRPASAPRCVCGDFNVAPDDRDLYSATLWRGKVMASEPEREAWRGLLALGLEDSFRLHHAEGNRYSWWDYRMLCFAKNLGLRIDHVLLSQPLAARCRAADIDRDQRKGKLASDHAPVWAELDLGA